MTTACFLKPAGVSLILLPEVLDVVLHSAEVQSMGQGLVIGQSLGGWAPVHIWERERTQTKTHGDVRTSVYRSSCWAAGQLTHVVSQALTHSECVCSCVSNWVCTQVCVQSCRASHVFEEKQGYVQDELFCTIRMKRFRFIITASVLTGAVKR